MARLGLKPAQVGGIIVGERACRVAAFSILAAFAVVDIYRKVFAGIAVHAAVTCTIASVDKNLVVAHAHL